MYHSRSNIVSPNIKKCLKYLFICNLSNALSSGLYFPQSATNLLSDYWPPAANHQQAIYETLQCPYILTVLYSQSLSMQELPCKLLL